jgi:hypothetical protein
MDDTKVGVYFLIIMFVACIIIMVMDAIMTPITTLLVGSAFSGIIRICFDVTPVIIFFVVIANYIGKHID